MYESTVFNPSKRNIRFSTGRLAFALIDPKTFNFQGGKLNFAAVFIVSVIASVFIFFFSPVELTFFQKRH